MSKVIPWIVALVVVGGVALAWKKFKSSRESLENPDYTVAATYDDLEVREYAPRIQAQVTVDGAREDATNRGFRILAGYIFGGNQPGESLPMTAPVLQQKGQGESLPMTAPVLQSDDGMRMAFVMPAGRSLADLPVPQDAQVSLTEVDWGEAAAIRFAGRGKPARFLKAETDLRRVLEAAGRRPTGPALRAQYNSPGAFPPLRRNEVIIPIESR
jgi:hypothetical protein